MSKLLRDLLDAKEPFFTQSLRELEWATEKKGIDTKLTAEIVEKTHAVISNLGLDSNDTTDKELFHALEHQVKEHNQYFAESLGTQDDAPVREVIPKLVEVANSVKMPRTAWLLKRSVAKDLLRAMPPRKMMSYLGYRSLESMLKNENFGEIYTALRFSEGEEWLIKYNELFTSKVTASDFEKRSIEIISMDHEKWVDIAAAFVKKRKHNIAHTKELGVIVVVPMQQTHMRGLCLKVLPLILHYINEIRLYSTFFKLKSTQPHFGKIMSEALITDKGTGATIANFHIHWRVIQRYFSELDDQPPEVFQPHVQPEDLYWRKAAEVMYEVNPKLKFWKDLDYVARPGENGQPVALNLFDVAFAYSNEESFETRYFYHMREALWNEIFTRYMGERELKKQILEQLDSDMNKPEERV